MIMKRIEVVKRLRAEEINAIRVYTFRVFEVIFNNGISYKRKFIAR